MTINRSGITGLSVLFTVVMIIIRILYTSETFFIFLVWNLFLAWLPFFISTKLNGRSSSPMQWVLLMSWLLFFPNAPYIITDLLHLNDLDGIPKWFDLLMLYSAAWNGLLLGLLSLHNTEQFLQQKMKAGHANLILVSCIFLSGFGVYAGRYLRWNSWEIFTHPQNIARDTIPRILHPHQHLSTWGMTLMLGSFLLIIYYTLKILVLTPFKKA